MCSADITATGEQPCASRSGGPSRLVLWDHASVCVKTEPSLPEAASPVSCLTHPKPVSCLCPHHPLALVFCSETSYLDRLCSQHVCSPSEPAGLQEVCLPGTDHCDCAPFRQRERTMGRPRRDGVWAGRVPRYAPPLPPDSLFPAPGRPGQRPHGPVGGKPTLDSERPKHELVCLAWNACSQSLPSLRFLFQKAGVTINTFQG